MDSIDTLIAAFVAPAVAAAGLAAMSVPVVIHLLSRRRFRRVPWAAMDFLLAAERENRRRMRLEQWILLALRCLAALLVGLLLARWYVAPTSLAAVLGGAAQTHRIVLLDDTLSMRYGQAGATVFDDAKAALRRLIETTRETAPADAFTVLRASAPDTPVLRVPAVRDTNPETLRDTLDALEPSNRGPCLRPAMDAVRRMLQDETPADRIAAYVISDFQAADWSPSPSTDDTPGDLAAATPLAALEDAAANHRDLRVVLIDVGRDDDASTYVEALTPQQPHTIAGTPTQFTAAVTHRGNQRTAPTSLRVFVGQTVQPPVAVPAIDPNRTVDVPIELVFPTAGETSLSVELAQTAPRDIAADNRRHAVVNAERAIRVLLVDGEPAPEPGLDEVALLAAALRPDGPVFSGIDIDTIDEAALDDAPLDPNHLVILANVSRVSEPAADALARYAETGGGIVFFLGDQVDLDAYNRALGDAGAALLPARLQRVVEAPAASPGFALAAADRTHPLLRHFETTDVPLLDGILTRRFIAATPDDRAASAPETAPATQPNASRTVLAFDDPDRSPALIEHPVGRGRVVLVTTSADKEWTNLPDWFTYVVLLQDLVQFAARPTQPGGADRATPGVPITLRLEPGRYQPQATLRTPRFPAEPEFTLEARPAPVGPGMVLTWNDTREPGVYRFSLNETAGGRSERLAAVNTDPRESNLTHADTDALRNALPGVPVTVVRAEAFAEHADDAARRELWPGVWLVLVAVLLAEQTLAWWFGSRTG